MDAVNSDSVNMVSFVILLYVLATLGVRSER